MNFVKIMSIALMCVASASFNTLDAAGIKFEHGSWQQIVDKAKSENKLIFIDFFTEWCGPCYNMAATVFTEPDVADFYNRNFVNAKIDAEKGEGSELAKKYGINSYPTYIFVDPATREPVHRSSSRQSAEQFIATGESALIPTRRSFYLQKEYADGNRGAEFLYDYIAYNHSVYRRDEVKKAFDELIAGGGKLTDPKVWDVFVNCIGGMDNRYLQEVSGNYAAFCRQYGKEAVDGKLAKETTYGSLDALDAMCDFEGKAFNRKMIEINLLTRDKNYDAAAAKIDTMIADPSVDQQQLIQRLKFIARIPQRYMDEYPSSWINKCVGYLQYIAYNQKERDDANIHQEYAAALEEMLRRGIVPDCMKEAPAYGKKSYSMRPDALKPKPVK